MKVTNETISELPTSIHDPITMLKKDEMQKTNSTIEEKLPKTKLLNYSSVVIKVEADKPKIEMGHKINIPDKFRLKKSATLSNIKTKPSNTETITAESRRFLNLVDLASGRKSAGGYSLLKDRIASLNRRVMWKSLVSTQKGYTGGLGVKNVVQNVEVKRSKVKKDEKTTESNQGASAETMANENKNSTSKSSTLEVPRSIPEDEEKLPCATKQKSNAEQNLLETSKDANLIKLKPENVDRIQPTSSEKSDSIVEENNNIPEAESIEKVQTININICRSKSTTSLKDKPPWTSETSSGSIDCKPVPVEVKQEQDSSETPNRDTTQRKKERPKSFAAISDIKKPEKDNDSYYSYYNKKRKRRLFDTDLPAAKAKLRIREDDDEFEEVELDKFHEYLSIDYASFFNTPKEVDTKPKEETIRESPKREVKEPVQPEVAPVLDKMEEDTKAEDLDKNDVTKPEELHDRNEALADAVYMNRLYMVEELLSKKADPNYVCETDGSTVLHIACSSDALHIVQALTAAGADLGSKTSAGNTPLHEAAKAGRNDTIMHLALNGADINETNYYGATALESTLPLGNVSTTQTLLKLSANSRISNLSGETAESVAEHLGLPPLIKVSERERKCASWATCPRCAEKEEAALPVTVKLIRSVSQGDIHYANKCLDEGASPNVRLPLALYGPGDATILHYAAQRGQNSIISELLNQGAEISARDIGGNTPLHEAAISDNAESVQVLLKAGADLEASSIVGLTPLHRAAAKGKAVTANYLLKEGANYSSEDEKGRTPADWARRKGFIDLSKELQERRFSSATLLKEEIDSKALTHFANLHAAAMANLEL